MTTDDKRRFLGSPGKKLLLFSGAGLTLILAFFPILPVFAPSNSQAQAETNPEINQIDPGILPETPLIQENSFIQASEHSLPKPSFTVIETIPVIITAYSSTVWQTDDTPYITAANTVVRDGVVATNMFPFGTKLRIPEYFGTKVFVVEDRMNERMGDSTIDVWFPSTYQARLFGVKYTYIQTLR